MFGRFLKSLEYDRVPAPKLPNKLQQKRLEQRVLITLENAKELHLDVRRLNVEILKQ